MRKFLTTTGIVILNLLPLITLALFFKLGALLGFAVMPMVIGIAFANYFYSCNHTDIYYCKIHKHLV